MTVKAKVTKFEAEILEQLRASSEPLTTSQLQRRLYLRSTGGVSRTCESLHGRGLITGGLTLDRLERTWWHL